MKKRIVIACTAAILCFAIGLGMTLLVGSTVKLDEQQGTTIEVHEVPEVPEVPERLSSVLQIESKSFYPDSVALTEQLYRIRSEIADGTSSNETLAADLEYALRELEQLGYYYDYADKLSISAEDGTVYGAQRDTDCPIGGGIGCHTSFENAKYTVNSDNAFFLALDQAKAGDVIYIADDAVIDVSDLKITNYPYMKIPAGITIASARGNNADGGILKMSLDLEKMFATASDVRLTGLVLQGPGLDAEDSDGEHFISSGLETRGNIEIDNCEISGFNGFGILASDGDVYIHHCYIHHVGDSGIHIADANVRLEYNLFSNCGYAVTVEEHAKGSLEASHNVEVGNGFGAMFRIAGGKAVILRNNTVLGSTLPIALEQMPAEFVVEKNLFALPEAQYDALQLYGPEENRAAVKTSGVFYDNKFDIQTPNVVK